MVKIRGKNDPALQTIVNALERYEADHPRAEVVVNRRNSVSVRIRIIDPDFEGVNKSDRHDAAWEYIASLPEERQSDISFLLLLTPDETANSFANYDFENPLPSKI